MMCIFALMNDNSELPAFLSILFQALFCGLSLLHGPFALSSLGWVYGLAFAWLVVVLAAQELAKAHDRKEFERFQKRSKLEFNTKLGCYSPV
jgi:hypothetical protein